MDFQIVRRLARQPLHKVTDSSLGTQALHLWTALRRLPKHVVVNLVKQESHRYDLGNGHIDLHAHNQLAEHMPAGEDPPLQDHIHTHLQHLPPVPGPREPPAWVPDDCIYNNTGRAYDYPQPVRTMAHIRGSQADVALVSRLQHTMRIALYLSALDPSLIPVHLQTRRAQLLLEQLPLLDRVAGWYAQRGIDIPPEYTICPCHLQQPETWEHFKRCPLAQGDNHLATWTPENTIGQHAGWGPATPLSNEVRRLMRQPEIKEAVLRGAVPLQLYRVVADHAPRPTIRHMQLTAITRADAQLQHRVQAYAQEGQQTSHDRSTYYNLDMHSLATSHTHRPAATTKHLPSHRPERACPLPCRGPIVLQTIPLLRRPEGEAPHPRPGNLCRVCMEVNDGDGKPLRGHDLGCVGIEQLHWFCSPCIANLWSCPLIWRPHRLCTAPRRAKRKTKTSHSGHCAL